MKTKCSLCEFGILEERLGNALGVEKCQGCYIAHLPSDTHMESEGITIFAITKGMDPDEKFWRINNDRRYAYEAFIELFKEIPLESLIKAWQCPTLDYKYLAITELYEMGILISKWEDGRVFTVNDFKQNSFYMYSLTKLDHMKDWHEKLIENKMRPLVKLITHLNELTNNWFCPSETHLMYKDY